MEQVIEHSIVINALSADVWRALTDPGLMKRWMAEPEMRIEVITGWRVASPIVIKGSHHIHFENKGTVLRFEPNSILQYTHLSSLSGLPDKSENYSTIEFQVAPIAEVSTSVTVRISHFPTESTRRHLDLYWRVTIQVLKRFVEGSRQNVPIQRSQVAP